MVSLKSATTTVTAASPSLARFLNPIQMVQNLWQHRNLIRQFTRRDIEGRYKGSFLGIFWSFITPLVMLAIYTYVFGIVFQARWPGARTGGLGEFAILLFCGLTTYNIFGETVGKASTQVINVPNYVKKVVFPLEILNISSLGAALFHAGISFSILLVAHLLGGGALSWTLLLVPIVLLPLLFLTLGISWFLSSLGVFLRDINYTVTLIIQILFFLTPIFYPIENLPEALRPYLRLNPLTSPVENMRQVVLHGSQPNWIEWCIWVGITGMVMILGYAFFMKTKKAFADVI